MNRPVKRFYKSMLPVKRLSSFARAPVNNEPRTVHNDICVNTHSTKRIVHEGEYTFKQDHILQYYEGSVHDESNWNRTHIPSFDHYDVSLVSQISADRLFYLRHLLQRWEGPISIAVMVNKSELSSVEKSIKRSNFSSRLRLTLYIVGVSDQPDCVYGFEKKKLVCRESRIYPRNLLRNLAVDNTLTSHFLLIDEDVWPAYTAYTALTSLPQAYLANPFNAMILPTFALSNSVLSPSMCTTLRSCVDSAARFFPKNKEALAVCLRRGKCTAANPAAHDYLPANWTNLPPTTPFSPLPCFRQRFLEPFVMVQRWAELPRFDTRFGEEGLDRAQWVEALRYMGYEFSVLAQSYAVDMPHPTSAFADASGTERKGPSANALRLYKQFLYELRANVTDDSRIVLCLKNRGTHKEN
ncbi:hypothetical protein WA556_001189 [Blastocystis sp. ATCC 50177/Nand II]